MTTSKWAGLGRQALRVTFVVTLALVAGLGLAQRAGWVELLEVEGGSMQPAIANGSLLITTTAEADAVATGDVVSIIGTDGHRVTHRVVDVTAEGITTRGDANTVNDAEVYPGARVDQVRAVVPGAGVALRGVRAVLSNPAVLAGLAVLVVLPLLGRRPKHLAQCAEVTA